MADKSDDVLQKAVDMIKEIISDIDEAFSDISEKLSEYMAAIDCCDDDPKKYHVPRSTVPLCRVDHRPAKLWRVNKAIYRPSCRQPPTVTRRK